MLATYATKADNVLTRLMRMPIVHPAGQALLRQIKAWRGKFFVFLSNREVPATNNISEREICPSVVFERSPTASARDGMHRFMRAIAL